MATAHPCRSAHWGAISAQKVGHPVYVGFIGGISIFGEGTIVGAYTTVG